MKRILINIFILIVSVIVAFLLLEGAAQMYVYKIAKRGKLFKPDEITGWAVKSHLNMQRKNADGDIWTIITDEKGFRRDRDWDSDRTRVLILGDSFAFGEGVDVEARFDNTIIKKGYSVLNTGVMAYGTGQQFLKAKPYLAQMNKDDIVIILTYYNDFYDISRKQQSGRKKPWFTLKNGELQTHTPQITLGEIVREKSYLYAIFASLLSDLHNLSDYDIAHASKVFQEIITVESQQLVRKGVRIILAYHGIPHIKDANHRYTILQTLETICENKEVECLNIDKHFSINTDKINFLADGHWNEKGHEMVGVLLSEKLFSRAQQ